MSSSKSQNVATQAVAPAKSKGTLFGLSREQLKIVNGGGGVIQMDPITSPFPAIATETPVLTTPTTSLPLTLAVDSTTP